MALALHDGATASLYRRLRVLRLGLDPDAFADAAAAAQTPPAYPADATAEDNKDGTPPKQQEEQGRTVASAAATPTPKRTTATQLLPLLACLRDGACPRLTTLDLDARLAPPIKNKSKSKKNNNEAEAAASSPTTAPSISPLTGEPLAAFATALRQGQLRRLEVRGRDTEETQDL